MTATGFVYDPAYLEHDTGYSHPESAQRLEAIVGHVAETGLYDRCVPIDAVPAPEEAIIRAHSARHLAHVREICAQAPFRADLDTPVCNRSYDVALRAAGGVMSACDAVAGGSITNAFCAVRPPGHHAERERAMGFCLFNNVAVAASHLRAVHGIRRILIVDWDVHHGNGTQNIFYDDPDTLFFSIHQSPLYPGGGAASERGAGAGEGATINVPVAPGSGDEHYREAFERVLLPAARTFAPEFVLISAGFDAHREDPLANINLSTSCFAHLTVLVKDIAQQSAGGRIVSVLEGGYALDALARSAAAHLRALMF
ncbi:MAG: histone deacetylase [Ignavibacteriae bacterium]|nr:histone deacetylase [Ignavibacteriota bacterium]